MALIFLMAIILYICICYCKYTRLGLGHLLPHLSIVLPNIIKFDMFRTNNSVLVTNFFPIDPSSFSLMKSAILT